MRRARPWAPCTALGARSRRASHHPGRRGRRDIATASTRIDIIRNLILRAIAVTRGPVKSMGRSAHARQPPVPNARCVGLAPSGQPVGRAAISPSRSTGKRAAGLADARPQREPGLDPEREPFELEHAAEVGVRRGARPFSFRRPALTAARMSLSLTGLRRRPTPWRTRSRHARSSRPARTRASARKRPSSPSGLLRRVRRASASQAARRGEVVVEVDAEQRVRLGHGRGVPARARRLDARLEREHVGDVRARRREHGAALSRLGALEVAGEREPLVAAEAAQQVAQEDDARRGRCRRSCAATRLAEQDVLDEVPGRRA